MRQLLVICLAAIAGLIAQPQRSAADITRKIFVGFDIQHITPELRRRYKMTLTGTGNWLRSPPTTYSAVITAVHPNSQAEAAGIRPGDVILQVSAYTEDGGIVQPSYPQRGKTTTHFADPTPDEVAALIQHGYEKGASNFELSLYRPSWSQEKNRGNRDLRPRLLYPKGYGSHSLLRRTKNASHKRWLEAQLALQRERREREEIAERKRRAEEKAQRDAKAAAEEARRRASEAEARLRDEEQRRVAAEAEAKRKSDEVARLAALLAKSKIAEVSALPTQPLGRRIALVLGNSTYQHAPRLANPANDARAIAALLRQLGFEEVVEHHDLARVAIEAALQAFGDRSAGADWAIIYYAGHGLQMDGRTFLLPVDARLSRAAHVVDEAVALERLMVKVREARKLRLVILDACRNNPFVRAMLHDGRVTRQVGRGLARIEPAGGVLIAYAARDGQLAEEGEGKHSPFTAALLKHLGEPGLEINMLFRKVRDTVIAETRGNQEPFVYGSLPSEGYYFRHGGAR